MNAQALIPLIATVAYIPLFIVLQANRPWDKKQKLLLVFLVSAMLWSLSAAIGRSDFLVPHKPLLVKSVLCTTIWMLVQFHYFVHSFYETKHTKIPLAYIFPVSAIVLAVLGYIPRSIEITPTGINVDYGIWIVAIALSFLFTLGSKDIYSLVRSFKVSSDPVERNQISYLLAAIGILTVFLLGSITRLGEKYPVSHIGNFFNASVLTYAVVTYHLVDVRIVFRRSLMWLSLGAAGVVAYAALFFLAHLAFGFDINSTTMAAAISIAVIAAILVYWLLKILSVKIERVFNGAKYDYRRHLSDLINKTYDALPLEQLGSQFTQLSSQSVGCQRTALLLPEIGTGNFIARFAYPPVKDNPMLNLKFRADSPIVTWLKRENAILLQKNLNIFPEFQSLWQEEKKDMESARVEIIVPLISKGELVAILALSDKQDTKLSYTVEDIDLLNYAASRAAVSLKKEYLHDQLREQDQELSLINRLTAIVTSSPSINEIFQGFTEELRKIVDVDWATIALIEGDKLRFLALSSTTDSPWQPQEVISLKDTATEWVCEKRKSEYEADLTQHHRFWTGEQHLKQGVRSIVYLPLILKNKNIGSLILGSRRPHAYSPSQIRLLEQVALQIATPIENAQLYAKAELRSRVDELTGLFNRRHFDERLKEEIARHSRHGDAFSLLLLDLDNFKPYNDIYGHPTGDVVLNQVGRIIRNSIRGADQAFRYGGDEFTVILPQTAPNDAYTVAERFRQQLASEMGAKEIAVTCSIGLASYPSDGVMPGELVTAADTALYYAKRTGANRTYLSSKILSAPTPTAGINTRASGLSAVYALASAVEAKDSCTYGHSKKVNTYAVALAEAIGLSPDEVSRISTAALLHDVGKIGISDNILNKKDKLSAQDWEVIKSHPNLGANIVSNVPTLLSCVPAILYHHEHYDGTGYPEGLQGEKIPLDARILAIADAFAAIASPRPYRDALSSEKAIEEIKRGAGRQFDPKLVKVFVGILKAGFPQNTKVG